MSRKTHPETCEHEWTGVRPTGLPAKMICYKCWTVRPMRDDELREADAKLREAIEALEK